MTYISNTSLHYPIIIIVVVVVVVVVVMTRVNEKGQRK